MTNVWEDRAVRMLARWEDARALMFGGAPMAYDDRLIESLGNVMEEAGISDPEHLSEIQAGMVRTTIAYWVARRGSWPEVQAYEDDTLSVVLAAASYRLQRTLPFDAARDALMYGELGVAAENMSPASAIMALLENESKIITIENAARMFVAEGYSEDAARYAIGEYLNARGAAVDHLHKSDAIEIRRRLREGGPKC